MESLKELMRKAETVIVDVRSPWEFEMVHIPGAKNIPLEEIPFKLDEFRSFNHPVVLYCRSGNRSGMAVSILKQHGMANVFNGGSLGDLQFLLN